MNTFKFNACLPSAVPSNQDVTSRGRAVSTAHIDHPSSGESQRSHVCRRHKFGDADGIRMSHKWTHMCAACVRCATWRCLVVGTRDTLVFSCPAGSSLRNAQRVCHTSNDDCVARALATELTANPSALCQSLMCAVDRPGMSEISAHRTTARAYQSSSSRSASGGGTLGASGWPTLDEADGLSA